MPRKKACLMSTPKYEPAPRNEPIYDANTQRKLTDLQKSAAGVRSHEARTRIARDQRGARLYVLMAEGAVSQAKLANVYTITLQGVAHVARKWAHDNDWPWPPTLPLPTAALRAGK